MSKTYIDEALEIVRGNREQAYGRPDANFLTTARMWSAWLSQRFRTPIELEPADVCHLQILLKEARIANSPHHRDSHVDIVGYVDCAEICHKGSQ